MSASSLLAESSANELEHSANPDPPFDARKPSPLLLLSEGRALYELSWYWLARPMLDRAAHGDGHPVLVLPGFVATGLSTRPLRSFLRQHEFGAHCWAQGRNLGPVEGLEDRLEERLGELHQRYGRKVSLVGWSLGGVFARLLANRAPDLVRSVITLGSPFRNDPKANRSWRLMELLSGQRIDQVPTETFARIRNTPPVPTTSVYSRTDGVAAWRCCIDREGPQAENVEVSGSHCGLGWNPLVLYLLADRLAQPEGSWQRFEAPRALRWLYPSS